MGLSRWKVQKSPDKEEFLGRLVAVYKFKWDIVKVSLPEASGG